ncbi:hypothetical protein EJ04DRAFT_452874 [Polyplosphaeria fusca]|uniref:LysM domain-containing protein n=1 Tax=Polyplosphaeria fusca TaxID=682080 RepID=A0A9P4UVD9_9PLEO|nr:hypothetical protein EJ04DRAFT_452874 [Polyplosphaeria fusca]
MKLFTSLTLVLGHTGLLSFGQQIPGSLLPFDLLGLSDSCLAAVNTTITSCPRWLPEHTGVGDASFDLLNDKQIGQLCGTSCAKDLEASRASIKKACTAVTDVMIPGESIAYPATFLADRYLYALQLGCLNVSNRSAGQYCDSVVASWLNQSSTNWTVAQNCSDCELGVQKLQLSSPFGYDDDGADSFVSLTSSCQAQGYTYATPTAYAINATSVPAPPTRTCTKSYTVQDEDTCVSISLANNVSTHGVITANGLDISCNLLPPAGSVICLPKTCNTYQLDMFDRCDDLTAGAHINRQQLLSWNPMIDDFCTNLGSWYGWNLCISSPDGPVTPGQGNTVTTDAPVPDNAQDQSNTHCGQWYSTVEGDLCGTISLAFSITVDDFYFLNPQVDHNCSNLWLNTSYCVAPVGNIATYSGYPTHTPSTVFTKPTPEPTTSVPPPVVTPPLSATASGTVGGCLYYMNAFDESLSSVFNLSEANSCDVWAAQADVSVDDLLAWNPSLSQANCVLQSGKSYCILKGKLASLIPSTDYDQVTNSFRSSHSTCIRDYSYSIRDDKIHYFQTSDEHKQRWRRTSSRSNPVGRKPIL